MVYKVTNELALDYMKGYFDETRNTHTHATRSAISGVLNLPKVHNGSGKRTFKYDRAKRWNGIPCNVRNIEKYQQFKTICKQF